ncbi:regulatory protein AsnC, partial [human gut metagenome]
NRRVPLYNRFIHHADQALCPRNEQLMDLLNNKLQAIPGVVSTETLISLEQSIKREIPVLLDED